MLGFFKYRVILIDNKLDLVYTLERSNLKIPSLYFYNWEKQIKINRKREF